MEEGTVQAEVVKVKKPRVISEAGKTARREALARGRAKSAANREANRKEALALLDATLKKEAPVAPVIIEKPAEVIFFGEVDINKRTGKPSSDYPAWYFDRQVFELKQEIESIERGLDLDIYKGKDKVKMRDQLATRKTRYEAIEESRPKLKDGDKDRISKTYKELGTRIGASMFTYSEMQRGTADAHVEAERMVMPCIEVKDSTEEGLCRQKGINIVGGKISRNDASVIYKIMGKALGEGILDVEALRNQK